MFAGQCRKKFEPTSLSLRSTRMLKHPYKQRVRLSYIREIKEMKVARLFKEAYEQDVLITHDDVAFLLHSNISTISRYARNYMKRTGEVLPTRGIIHDIGRAITHKRIILKLYKNGYQTPDISRMTNHTEQACDRYIKAYKKVEKLCKIMNIDEIAQVLEMSRSLVEEYINILNEEED